MSIQETKPISCFSFFPIKRNQMGAIGWLIGLSKHSLWAIYVSCI